MFVSWAICLLTSPDLRNWESAKLGTPKSELSSAGGGTRGTSTNAVLTVGNTKPNLPVVTGGKAQHRS